MSFARLSSERLRNSTKIAGSVAALLSFVVAFACHEKTLEPSMALKPQMLTDQQIVSLMSKKIFFGHQSVGNNILQGVRDLAEKDPRLKLNIVKSSEPQAIAGPALVEFEIGENGSPQSKMDAFSRILDKGVGAQGGIAMFKFCYVDINASTDIPKLFASYQDRLTALKAKYPSWKPVHITIPLTTVEPVPKAWIKSIFGRTTAQDINVKRNQFNTLMRQTYAGIDPIFDLAEVESTHEDGSRAYFMRGNDKIYTLAAEFTDDGGHLNQVGQQVVAGRLLFILARL